MTSQIADLQTHWPPIAPVFSIRNEHEYDSAVARLNALLDEIGTNEKHPLYGLLDTLGTLIHSYESENHVIPDARGADVLQSLMEEHGVSVTNLPEIGAEDVVRRYLAGKEELSIEQVRALARRFHVSPSAFI
jgi:HTH-type transcriptional regulator/antitoxin HigA